MGLSGVQSEASKFLEQLSGIIRGEDSVTRAAFNDSLLEKGESYLAPFSSGE